VAPGSGPEILGHERQVELLWSSLREARLPQALLLTGPAQVGKRTLALALARAINCERGPGECCGACRACRLTASGAFPDIHLVELREGRQRIGIREVQELQSELARVPSEGRQRIALIDTAERMSPEAENCLLKTLEEPPPQATIILTTEEAESLLPTTISRCRQFRLRPVAASRIASHLLETRQLPAAEATKLADLADGRPGWALEVAADPKRLEAYRSSLERLQRAVDSSRLVRLELARSLAEQWSGKSEQVREELRVWARWWRSLLLLKIGLGAGDGEQERARELAEQAERFTLYQLRDAVAVLTQARADLDQNVNARLALDLALLRLPRPTESLT
jgi:DNA polymerase III subunit delta'